MLNIVMPLAGLGQRFASAGYRVPKPLIPVHGVPMIELVIANVRPRRPHRFHFVVLQEHLDRFGLGKLLGRLSPGCVVAPLRTLSEGAAVSVLQVRASIDNDRPLLIVNGDQWVDADLEEYLSVIDRRQADGSIMTMRASDPKWSYVLLDPDGVATRVAEKEVISDSATVGLYHFRHGADFVRGADRMISKDLRTRGEFYVAPVFNELILGGKRIVTHDLGDVGVRMFGLGTPEDLDGFVRHPASLRAVENAKA